MRPMNKYTSLDIAQHMRNKRDSAATSSRGFGAGPVLSSFQPVPQTTRQDIAREAQRLATINTLRVNMLAEELSAEARRVRAVTGLRGRINAQAQRLWLRYWVYSGGAIAALAILAGSQW